MRQFSDLMHDVGRNSTWCRHNHLTLLPSDLYPFHFDEEWLSLRMSCSLMQIEAQNWKDFSVAISQTPRDDAMRCSMPSEVKTPNDFLLLWKKTFLKIKQNFRGHQLRIVWWNPLACKRRWAPQMLNIHKCSKSQLIWDIIKTSVRVIPLLFFNFWIFAPKLFRDRVWMVIYFWQDFISCQVKNQSFSSIASLCCFLFFAS